MPFRVKVHLAKSYWSIICTVGNSSGVTLVWKSIVSNLFGGSSFSQLAGIIFWDWCIQIRAVPKWFPRPSLGYLQRKWKFRPTVMISQRKMELHHTTWIFNFWGGFPCCWVDFPPGGWIFSLHRVDFLGCPFIGCVIVWYLRFTMIVFLISFLKVILD